MDNAVKAIIIGASIVIVMTVVGIGFKVMTMGQNLASDSMNQLEAMTGEMAEANVVNMDGKTISGSNVVSFIKQRDDSVKVFVKTLASTNTSQYRGAETKDADGKRKAGSKIENLTNVTQNDYINPNGKFLVKVVRNTNQVITSITFTQE